VSVTETMAGWARELSEVGGRNTLLWAPDSRSGHLDLTNAHPGGVSMLLAGRRTTLSDLVRESVAFDEALATARRLHEHAETLRDERGLAACFLAIGVATWDPPRARAVVEAPVLLRTATLRPTTTAEADFVVDLGQSVEVNPALVNYLQSVAGIPVDAASLSSLTELRGGGGFDPYPVYAALGRLCVDVPGFAVAPRLVLGTYPYGKPIMVADVGRNTQWLAQVPLLAALAGDSDAAARVGGELPATAPLRDPEREVLALDLDGDQQEVLEHVRAGRPLVLHAPPGTGRTQTVAAIVAALAHDDRSVLYVTPSRATIQALRARLATVGLRELVLDCIGAGEDRGPVVHELGQALVRAEALDDRELAELADPRDRIERATDIAERQQALHNHVEALHERRDPWGVTAYQIQHELARLTALDPAPGSRVRLTGAALRAVDRARLAELTEELTQAARDGAWSSAADPWYAADVTTDEQVARAREIVERLAGDGLDTPREQLDTILRESSLPPAHDVADWGRALETMHGVRETLEVFRPEIFDIPLDEHVVATGSVEFRAGQSIELGPLTRWRVRRQARRMLRPGRPPADLHAELVSARAQRRLWHDLVGAGGRPEISPRLDEAQAAYATLHDDLAWLSERLAPTEEGGGLTTISLTFLRARLTRLRENLGRLEVLPRVTPRLVRLREAGLGEVVDDLARRGVPAEQVGAETEHLWWASLALDVTTHDTRYAAHDGASLRDQATELAELDAQARIIDAGRVRALVDQRSRQRARANPRQTDLLHTQSRMEHGQLPFADLFREAEQVVLALRPCVAVSPYAAAQLIEPGTVFDVVIVDDADLVTTAETVSALSRAGQVLVVGDPGGRGPSAFRVGLGSAGAAAAGGGGAAASSAAGAAGAAGAAAAGKTEAGARHNDPDQLPLGASLLAAASAVLPTRRLSWWHEPVDPRLHLADPAARRFAVPGPTPPVLRLERADGTGAVLPGTDGAIESTEAEVAKVVEVVVDALRTDVARSLAIVTLTEPMARLVRTALQAQVGLLEDEPEVVDRLADAGAGGEPLVVVPYWRAQGLTRDIVVLSVGYGRTPHGRVLHRFPTLAGEQAEHELLAATTLARRELVVVTTLDAADLDPDRLRTPGATRLLDLLRVAERGGLGEGASGDPDPLMDYLATRLRAEGLVVEQDLGVGEHRIELVVGHPSYPGRWLVAVEGDGPAYAALPGVRGRDRLRGLQLRRMGWEPARVWSTDLFRDPAREVARIVAVTKRAAAQAKRSDASREDDTAPLRRAGSDGGAAGGGVAGGGVAGRADDADPSTAKRAQRSPFDSARDDSDVGWGDRPASESAHDRWLEEQRPPHWE